MRRGLAIAAVLVAAGCGGDDGGATPDADISDLVWAPCAPATRVGGFEILLTDLYTAVQGKVYDGVVPGNVLETVTTDGDCRLVEAPTLVCDPACDGTQTCDTGGTCIPYPVAVSVGDATVTGLKVPVTMSPTGPTNFYTNPGELPNPGFDPGAAIALDTDGGAYQPLHLEGWGVTQLAVAATEVTVESGAAVEVTWTPPPEDGPSRVRINLNINGHGLIGTHVLCEAADTGSFTIPEPLVTALVADGVSGFPTLEVTRASADSATIAPGCVDLVVQSAVVLEVIIPGLTSCDNDDDCEAPETCQGDLTCG